MSENAAAEEYVHGELENPKEQVRLLEIRRSGNAGSLRCQLHVFPLRHAPPYAALSYVWGHPSPTRTLTVNEASFQIRSNCFYALEQASRARHCIKDQPYLPKTAWKYFWVDAICVNQTNTEERSHQVAIMYEIFSGADAILSSVGSHFDDSKFLLDALCFPLHLSIFKRGNPSAPFRWKAIRRSMHKWSERQLAAMVRHGHWERLKQAHICFGKRTYWTRVWIAQELYQLDRVLLMCGDDFLWASILYIYTANMRGLNRRLCDNEPQPAYDQKDFDTPMLDLFRCSSSGLQKVGSSQMSMDLAMRLFSRRECTDPRDRVYGALRLIAWPGQRPAIKPDYYKSPLQLALDFLGCNVDEEYPWGTLCVGLAIDTFSSMRLEPDQNDVALLMEERQRRQGTARFANQNAGCSGSNQQKTPTIKDKNRSHAVILEKDDSGCLQLPRSVWNFGRDTSQHDSDHQTYAFNSPAAENSKSIRIGSAIVGYACSDAQSGDLLVALHRASPLGPILWLILRHHPWREVYEIIGHAVIHKAATERMFELVDYCHEDCRWRGDHKMPGLKLIRFHFGSADLIVLAARLKHQSVKADSELTGDDAQWELLDANFTSSSDPFSSYAVEALHVTNTDNDS